MKKFIIASMVILSMSAYAFTPKMTQKEINIEIQKLLAQDVTPSVILSSMQADGISEAAAIDSLVSAGVDISSILPVPTAGKRENRDSAENSVSFSYSNSPSSAGGGRTSVSRN